MHRNSIHPVIFLIISLMIAGLAFVGCEGDQGPAGPAGVNPDMPPIITAAFATVDSVGTGESTVLVVNAYDPNGDPMTYLWTAASGVLATPSQSYTSYTPPSGIGLYEITVTVTDNDGSVSAVVRVGVNTYVPSVTPSFLGDNANRCSHCHQAKVEGWHGTHHAEAYAALVASSAENNPYCLQCHTTGWDDIVAFDGSIVTPGVDNAGYDDFPNANLRNVTCEACHGPMGPDFSSHEPDVELVVTGETCNRCHSQYEEYETSGHGHAITNAGGLEEFNTEFNRSSCNPCHTSEGFIKAWDADWATREVPAEAYQVSCATCHDVHSFSEDNPAYLRGLAAFPIVYGGPDYPAGFEVPGEDPPTLSYGKGQLCAQCHHARRSESNVQGQIENGSAHPGPHGSPQADMTLGYGSYEIPGYTYDRASQHTPDLVIGEGNLADMCVTCHVHTIPGDSPGHDYHGHSFAPVVEACNACHATPNDFDYHGKRTEILNLMAQLMNMLPNDGTEPLFTTDATTREQREAAYAWFFVYNEGSSGVHNYEYAHSLLTNAIDYLTPGQPILQQQKRMASRN
ncbi:MAG: PKD domain-containing protein [Calditrichaeota bacterium]|nr:PKD domain-containing protein [Calditrichota bacterium]MCB9367074.1 PKD domain-containing protein [Calditrichota bacterium]MCB9391442.1 PKD domain-containing protein [Calditrichota bacterium]